MNMMQLIGLFITFSCMFFGVYSISKGVALRERDSESVWMLFIISGVGCMVVSLAASVVLIKAVMDGVVSQ